MNTPDYPLPHIVKHGTQAGVFAGLLTLALLASLVVLAVWGLGYLAGWWSAPVSFVPNAVVFLALSLFIFKAAASLVDYVIFAVARAFTEYLEGLVTAFAQSAQPDAAAPASPTNQRDSAVAYLHDFLTRPRQALADVADPLHPKPAA